MPLATLDRTPPPFFKQGPSAFTRLLFFAALAILLMVADARWKITQPLRLVLATLLQPVQQVLLVPVRTWEMTGHYVAGVGEARTLHARAQRQLSEQAERVTRMVQLERENERLRALLTLRPRIEVATLAAEVLYDAQGAVRGVATGNMGVGKDGVPHDGFQLGMELLGKYTVFAEGARGHLGRQLIERFGLLEGRDAQSFSIGIKELWEVPAAAARPASPRQR